MEELNVNELRAMISKKRLGWEPVENKFSTYSKEQLKKMCGVLEGKGEESFEAIEERALKNYQTFKSSVGAKDTMKARNGYPVYHNWREKGMMTAVKDQGTCGSCVAFGNIAAMEAMYKISTGYEHNFSEAHLFYCHGVPDGAHCDTGWFASRGAYFLKEKGVVSEATFPYIPNNHTCSVTSNNSNVYKIKEVITLNTHNEMKDWIYKYGPVVSRFNVYTDFFNYGSGIYRKAWGEFEDGHCICIVGYDDINNCWICKNSWGADWGDNGYFRIGYGECGIDSTMYGLRGFAENGFFPDVKISCVNAYDGIYQYVSTDKFGYRRLGKDSNGDANVLLFGMALLALRNKAVHKSIVMRDGIIIDIY